MRLCCKPRLSVAPEPGLQFLSIGNPPLTRRAIELPPVGTGSHIRRLCRGEECAERVVKNTPAGYGEEELRSGEERTCGAWYGGRRK